MPVTSARTGIQFAAPVAALIVLSSCALERSNPSALPHVSPSVLSEQQISATSAATAFDVIQRLRPIALNAGGPRSEEPIVYMDRTRLGGVAEHTRISTIELAEIRFLSPVEASAMFGQSLRSAGGAILLTSKVWSRSASPDRH